MSESDGSTLEQYLSASLEPVCAPASLWYRVDAELAGRPPVARRRMPRLALAFGVVLVALVSVGWYIDRPMPTGPSRTPSIQLSRGEHSCSLCHV
jgi:hypothetical protein